MIRPSFRRSYRYIFRLLILNTKIDFAFARGPFPSPHIDQFHRPALIPDLF